MPIYEYRCADCRRVTSALVRSPGGEPAACSHCSGGNLTRLISHFAFHRSWGESLDWVPSSETLSDVDRDDPASMGAFMDDMQAAMGGQVSPDYQEMRREISSDADSAA